MTRQQHLKQVVDGKRALDVRHDQLPPAPFRGWHQRGYLPHCDRPGLVQFVTFRLDDAMPVARRAEWLAFEEIADARERQIQRETYLDAGHGECQLRRPEIAAELERALLHFEGERYRLLAWVVMPNHVHVVFEVGGTPLDKVLHNWKRRTAWFANRVLGRTGRFWQPEYWDRYVREAAHAGRAIRYTEANPVKAGLVREPTAWPWSSANPKWQWEDATATGRWRGARLVRPQERSAG